MKIRLADGTVVELTEEYKAAWSVWNKKWTCACWYGTCWKCEVPRIFEFDGRKYK